MDETKAIRMMIAQWEDRRRQIRPRIVFRMVLTPTLPVPVSSDSNRATAKPR